MIKWIWEKLNCNKWSTYHPHDLLLCCQFSPNWWIDLVQSQTKSQESFFIEIEELIAKCMWKYKEPRITQPNFEKEEQGFWLTLLILRCTVHALCLITQSFSTEKSHSDSFWPYGLQPLRLLCPWELSRQEYWSGLPCPPLDLHNPGIEPRSPTLHAES